MIVTTNHIRYMTPPPWAPAIRGLLLRPHLHHRLPARSMRGHRPTPLPLLPLPRLVLPYLPMMKMTAITFIRAPRSHHAHSCLTGYLPHLAMVAEIPSISSPIHLPDCLPVRQPCPQPAEWPVNCLQAGSLGKAFTDLFATLRCLWLQPHGRPTKRLPPRRKRYPSSWNNF